MRARPACGDEQPQKSPGNCGALTSGEEQRQLAGFIARRQAVRLRPPRLEPIVENFIVDAVNVARAQLAGRPITSVRQAQQLISDQAAALHSLVVDRVAPELSDFGTRERTEHVVPWEQARQQLVEIAATAIQAADQLGIVSRQDAIGKSIPW